MKNCYDSLLSAAAATANSAYGIKLLVFVAFVIRPFPNRICFGFK
jgi:hypothetical protein